MNAHATPIRSAAKTRIFLGGNAGYDPWLLGCTLALLALGLVMVCSASTSIGTELAGSPTYYLQRQLAALVVAVFGALVVLYLPIRTWQQLSPLALLAAFVALTLVLIEGLGHEVNGSRRWLGLGPVAIQASEPAKLAVVVYLAGYLTRHQVQVERDLAGFFKPILVLALLGALLLLEPDYGSTVVLFATGIGMLFIGGVPIGRFAFSSAFVFACLLGVATLAPYRVKRLTGFLDPWADRFDSGFQLTQALIAFGRGEWFGLGLGNGIQKLFYLPEAHTDFVFAVIGEELGLLGSLLVIVLFTLLVWRILYLASLAKRVGADFAAHLCYGVGLLLGIQAFVNMGVAMGVLPTKGLTLPLVSYGNNSLVVTLAALAMVLRMASEIKLTGDAERAGAPIAARADARGNAGKAPKKPVAGRARKRRLPT